MCHFITATLPRGADADAAAAIARRHGRVWVPCENPHVISQLGTGEGYFFTTSGHCDCGTAVGSLARPQLPRRKPEKQVPKLRRKGWSEAKIQRWLDEKHGTEKRRAAEAEARVGNPPFEAEMWVSLLRDLLAELVVDHVGLLLHMYCGGLETEPIHLLRSRSVEPPELTVDLLLQAEEDVLYRFQKRAS